MINNPSALCFGEILFDVFGDDRCIGGAPFNFAAHFAQLGGEAVMVSAVGDDELGKEAIEYTRRYGISDAFSGCKTEPVYTAAVFHRIYNNASSCTEFTLVI